MQLIRNMSVRHKLMLICMTITMASLLLASIAFITSDRLYAQKTVVDSLNTMASMIAANSSAAMLFGDSDAGLETLGFLKSQNQVQAGILYLRDGSIFATYRRAGFYDDLPQPGPHKQSVKFSEKYAEIFSPVVHMDDVIGLVYLRTDMTAVRDRLNWFLGIVAVEVAAQYLIDPLRENPLPAVRNQQLRSRIG